MLIVPNCSSRCLCCRCLISNAGHTHKRTYMSNKGGTMKKLINRPEDVVKEALAGMQAAHSDLIRVDIEQRIIVRKDAPIQGKVGVISGGGSGHEPMHGGFVGYGMLDAACPGEVFTSPVPDQMLAATKAVNGGAGVLHIVKNYTGDVLNFQMAAELAADEGIEVVSVVTNDDVAVQDSLYTAGRRGVGATVFVEKIAGALAEEGAGLDKVAAVAREVNERSRSLGVALSSCNVTAAGKPTFELAESEIEMGNYITSLEMQGFSVTVCQLTDELTRLWDAPVDTPALRWGR